MDSELRDLIGYMAKQGAEYYTVSGARVSFYIPAWRGYTTSSWVWRHGEFFSNVSMIGYTDTPPHSARTISPVEPEPKIDPGELDNNAV